MIIDAEIYGITPNANIDILDSAPPLKHIEHIKNASSLLLEEKTHYSRIYSRECYKASEPKDN